jgi:tripartite-type tricarboxylate transporter receptor subunit TctC
MSKTPMFPKLIVLIGFFVSASLFAQTPARVYPSQSVKIVVPFPVGQTTDIIARSLSQEFTEIFGQSFFVDDKGGAAGIIGTEFVKNSQPDGYTLLMASSGPLGINPSLYSKLPYDTLNDFNVIGMLVTVPQFLVLRKDFPANNLKELMALIKQNKGKYNYGSGGNGLTNHLTMELLKLNAGLEMIHIPYKGSAASTTALLGGEIDMLFESGPAVMPLIKDGKIKALAVGSQTRSVTLPDVPTVAEAGVPGFKAVAWAAFLAPANTPKPVIERLNVELKNVLDKPSITERFATLVAETFSTRPEQAREFIKKEIENWAVAVKASGAKAE